MHARARSLSVLIASVCMTMLCVTTRAAHAQHAQLSTDIVAPEADRAPEAFEAEVAPDANEPMADTDATTRDARAINEPRQVTGTTRPVRASRVDTSAPLSGGERWVKENGQWRLRRVNYRYLDRADYAPRPELDPGINDFPEPASGGVSLWSRWFSGRAGWGYGGYGYGYGAPYGVGGYGFSYWQPGWSLSWGTPGWGYYGRSPWSYGISPWSPYGYGAWRGVPRYGWGQRGRGFRSGFGFHFGF